MLSRPTTEQILLDCCRELMEGVLPALSDETAQVRVIMLDAVLKNTAVRAAHEIAWMLDETAAIDDYVHAVRAAVPGDEAVRSAAEALAAAPRHDLHLDAVVEAYCVAGKAFSAALEAAVTGRLPDLVARGEQLLEQRRDREIEVMAGWSSTGR
ncbi:MAG TPA: hypothetical protein VGJ44_25630 [Kribbellaceae bacterium]